MVTAESCGMGYVREGTWCVVRYLLNPDEWGMLKRGLGVWYGTCRILSNKIFLRGDLVWSMVPAVTCQMGYVREGSRCLLRYLQNPIEWAMLERGLGVW